MNLSNRREMWKVSSKVCCYRCNRWKYDFEKFLLVKSSQTKNNERKIRIPDRSDG